MITRFRGQYGFLSNMHDCDVKYNGLTFKNSESAFQAQKCISESHKFTNMSGPKAKRYALTLPLREDWAEVRVGIMCEVVYEKFSQNPELKKKLLDTGLEELIEGNDHKDTFWGVYNGNGKNMLGKILMKVRSELGREC